MYFLQQYMLIIIIHIQASSSQIPIPDSMWLYLEIKAWFLYFSFSIYCLFYLVSFYKW